MRGQIAPEDYRCTVEALSKLPDDDLYVVCRVLGASVPDSRSIEYDRNAWGQEIMRAIVDLRLRADQAERYREGLRLLGVR